MGEVRNDTTLLHQGVLLPGLTFETGTTRGIQAPFTTNRFFCAKAAIAAET